MRNKTYNKIFNNGRKRENKIRKSQTNGKQNNLVETNRISNYNQHECT